MKILHLDIETAPNKVYTWGLFKQNVMIEQIVESGYTLCWAAKWDDKKEIMFSSIDRHSEVIMIHKIHRLLEEADAVVHYNGRRFDMPILNKEFIKYNLPPPAPYQQIDLLETARRRFKFTSNKLDYVAQFLGLGAKTQHKGMRLWNECMAGDKKAWRKMEEYNKQDVRLLPKLYKKLLPWIMDHPNHALYTDREEILCTNCGSTKVKKNGIETLKTQSYQRYKCTKCGTPLRGRSTILPLTKRKTVLTSSKL